MQDGGCLSRWPLAACRAVAGQAHRLRTVAPGGTNSAALRSMSMARGARIRILAALMLFWPSRDARADSLRCGNRIVATGDSLHVVRSLCGEPTAERRRFETRTEERRVLTDCRTSKTPHRRCERVEKVIREVQIDEWTYDFGPQRFVHYLTFLDGKLARVATGSYGSEP